MKGKRATEEEIIRVPKDAEEIGNVREVCRKHNITEQTFYRWRNKYGGMDVSEAKRLKQLEKKNDELKKLVEEPSLDNRMLEDINSRKWRAWQPGERRH